MITKEQCTSYVKNKLLAQKLQVEASEENGVNIVRFGPAGCGFVGSLALAAINSEEEAAIRQLDAMLTEALQAASTEPALRAKS